MQLNKGSQFYPDLCKRRSFTHVTEETPYECVHASQGCRSETTQTQQNLKQTKYTGTNILMQSH